MDEHVRPSRHVQRYDEFEEYTSQMLFLDNLKEALTPANLKIIVDLLSEERVDYDTFASYLANDIVSSALYNMSKGNNPKMSSDYFETYEKRISEQKQKEAARERSKTKSGNRHTVHRQPKRKPKDKER